MKVIRIQITINRAMVLKVKIFNLSLWKRQEKQDLSQMEQYSLYFGLVWLSFYRDVLFVCLQLLSKEVLLKERCKNQHRITWRSQPINNRMPTGNINISAGILFSGNTFQRIKEIMTIANVAFISQWTSIPFKRSYFILHPAFHWVYTTNRALLFESAKEESEIHLLGDGMCDSPGNNAKYGTYTLMDSQIWSYSRLPHLSQTGSW